MARGAGGGTIGFREAGRRPVRPGHPMTEEEKAPRIVVRDRRAFAPDGSRRQDVEPRSEPPAEAAALGSEPKPAPGASTAAAPAQEPPPEEDPRFKQLVSLLFSQAAMLLEQTAEGSEQSGPVTDAQRAEATQGLQAVIGLLEVVEEKTRGRLAPGDARLVSQALYQLRIAYMERAKA
ncbi:MAG: DUF1844 domain-containing protein [Acidobacteria bacterium]|nr:DUF1844 domain-containing protein [Acidobacteriota bacterium]MXX85634.1 DUF1844 domain-containing protein [Acidobacteriota bacterium]MYE42582.1 DUF1844 domain-containing protein [Acidobacteriota bacterium]MYG74094.1 DUF1844 domain-containing protein [Acidobacteriota bacterium]